MPGWAQDSEQGPWAPGRKCAWEAGGGLGIEVTQQPLPGHHFASAARRSVSGHFAHAGSTAGFLPLNSPLVFLPYLFRPWYVAAVMKYAPLV